MMTKTQNYRKSTLLFCVLCLMISSALAQIEKWTIQGTVMDSNGPLAGVSVSLKTGDKSTFTDNVGNYALEASTEDVLVFTYVGFISQEIKVGRQSVIPVTLVPDLEQLSEVVVIGYGQQQRRDLTTSIVSVKTKDLEDVPLPSVDGLMQGRAAGVRVTSFSGAPGAGFQVSVRGNTSISAGNEPLYVVDGIPMRSESFDGPLTQTNVGSNVLADINPDNIASIEIMKDAAAAAIYGARAANGVVLITTKRGIKGQSRLSFTSYFGMQNPPRKIPLLNGPENKTLLVESNLNGNFGFHGGLLDVPGTEFFYSFDNDVDWQDQIMKTGAIQNYNVSLSGGEQRTRYFLSMGYFGQTGTILSTNYERLNAQVNVDYDISPKARIGNTFTVSRSNIDRMDEGAGQFNILRAAYEKNSYHPVYARDRDGNDLGYFGGFTWGSVHNPLQLAQQVVNNQIGNRVLGNVFFEYDILNNLTFRTSFAVDYTGQGESRFIPRFDQSSIVRASEQRIEDLSWINENVLTYNNDWKGIHRLSAVAGFSQQESGVSRLFGETHGHPSNTIPTLNAGPTIVNTNSTINKWGINSLFARASYIYNDRYSLSANVRRDGSSRFGENNRYAIFPSASMYWRISAEPFMKSATWIDDLKLRSSYGQTGNQNIGNYASRALYVPGANYLGQPGYTPANVGVPDLSWEITHQFNLALDFTLLNGRLTLIPEYYVKSTRDLLLNMNLPSISGFTSTLMNIGDTENKGVELAIHGKIMQNSALTWDMDFNIGRNKNRIVRLPGGTDIFVSQRGFTGIGREGQEIGTFYGWKALGVFPRDADAQLTTSGQVVYFDPNTPLSPDGGVLRRDSPTGLPFMGGDVIWEDVNGDGVINNDDLQVLGYAQPKFYGGFNNTFAYKGFQLSLFFQYQYGNQVINETRRIGEGMTGVGNYFQSTLNRWRKQGDITTIPKAVRGDAMGNARPNSSRWVEDGSYMRLKTISLSYNMPSSLLGSRGLKNIRVYVTGQNLLTFTRYLGTDPEFTSNLSALLAGIDHSIYPQPRTVTLGLNAGF